MHRHLTERTNHLFQKTIKRNYVRIFMWTKVAKKQTTLSFPKDMESYYLQTNTKTLYHLPELNQKKTYWTKVGGST